MISTFYPVVAGRVSDGLTRNRALYQIQSDQLSLQRLQTQLATGLKFQTPSESPSAAIRVMELQREQEFKNQAIVNLQSARSYLNTSESTLAEVQSILNDVKGISIESVSNTIGESERDALVSQIDSYLARVVAIGNQKSRDRYLFAGGDVDQQPIELRNSVTRYSGNDLDLLAIADSSDYVAHNITAQRAFGVISDGVTGTVDLDPDVTASTRVSDLNRGNGIGTGAIQFSNGTESVVIDFAGVETLGDIVEIVDGITLGGRALNATISGDGLQINYDDGLPGTIRVTDAGSGRIAKNLGIATTTSSPTLPIQGLDLDPILRTTTALADLNGGLGLNLADGLRIHQGDQTYTVDVSNAQTVEDLINAIQNSGAAVIADIAPGGQSLRIRSIESGSNFSIAESTGTLAAQLGLRTFNGLTRLAELNHGQGLELSDGADLTFTRSDGTEFSVDIDSAVTIQDVIDLVNNHADNQDPALKITVSLQPFANGLQLTSPVPVPPTPVPIPAPPPPTPIEVRSTNGGSSAVGLGFAPRGAQSATATEVAGSYVILGNDVNPYETNGVYNSLIRLRNAIQVGDSAEIGRASAMIDNDIDRVSLTRGDLGIRQQRIDSVQQANEDQVIELKSRESDEHDVDIADVISQLSARQAAYEANLQLLAQVTRASIFDYI